jgi:quinoprotein glucose dehydrogenase
MASMAWGQANWPNPGNDPGGTKYSTLKQITPTNVSGLKRAWTYDTGDIWGGFRPWEITPIVIDGVMYFNTTGGNIVALDADKGTEIWKFELKPVTSGRFSTRGIAYWPGSSSAGPRIVATTTTGMMLELDPKTGQLIRSFGKDGLLNLKTGITEKFGANTGYDIEAAPAIYRNLAIFAPSSGEQGRYGIPGDPRAIDLYTGEEAWRFHSVPQPGDPNFGTWGPDGWQDRKGHGIWTSITIDQQNGLAFVPFGNATDQNYGGSRPGTNLYSCSIVALDANTGKLKWHFQITHHDIFDWDLSAPPTLIDVVKDGKTRPAVAQLVKKGLLFILDRFTGEPIYGVEERPVFATDAPGDKAWPTQPFPIKPGPVARISMTREEVNKTSPDSEKSCKAQYDNAVQAGPDTPYLWSVPSLVFPSSEGGGSWGSPAFEPTLGYIIGNTRSVGTMGKLEPMMSSGILPSYSKRKIPFDDPAGYPCSAPPWGELFAVNANTGEIAWRVPLGEYQELTSKGVPKTGTPNAGAPIVTATGLVFIGATADSMFRAFAAKTGKELWATRLENSAMSVPLTYEGKSGKQYVAITSGGGVTGMAMFVKPPVPAGGHNIVVAYALP